MQGSQDVHAPDLEWGSGLDTGAVNILLDRSLLGLELAGMAVTDDWVDLGNQAEHEHPFPAEVDGGSHSGVS